MSLDAPISSGYFFRADVQSQRFRLGVVSPVASFTGIRNRYNPGMNIVLIGYRASGKTSLGVALAKHLGLAFVDTDKLVLQRFGTDSVGEVWQEHGEPEFRRVEVEIVQQVVSQQGQVIALGGGTLMQGGARQAVEQAPDTLRVYLACQPEQLIKRIQADQQTTKTRPNLTKLGGGIEEVVAMVEQREPVYLAVADKVIDVTDLTPDEVFQRAIQEYL